MTDLTITLIIAYIVLTCFTAAMVSEFISFEKRPYLATWQIIGLLCIGWLWALVLFVGFGFIGISQVVGLLFKWEL